jgi:cytochrome c oxidase subunit II
MNDLHVDLYEKVWMWSAVLIIGVFVSAVSIGAYSGTQHPASHVETIDPKTARTDARFARPGVIQKADGSVEVIALAQMFMYAPNEIHVPAGKRVTFRLTSPDVIHGFQIVATNGNTMVVPGYVSQFTTVFEKPGNYLIVCNEFCGLGHHMMHARLIVEGARP